MKCNVYQKYGHSIYPRHRIIFDFIDIRSNPFGGVDKQEKYRIPRVGNKRETRSRVTECVFRE